jgi:(R,R)-butanediol dehydrogenase/meso-butanediol dehydrogenase/diacetyl reductase
MRAAVFYGRQDLRLEEVPEPSPRPGEIKLRVLYNGICGSDLHEYYDGPITTRVSPHPLTGVKNPVILGHELSGEVIEVGAGVEDLGVGDRVAVEPVETCGRCLYCTSGQYNHCGMLAFHGYNRNGGGLSQFTTVRRSMAHKLPRNLTAMQGALIEPMNVVVVAIHTKPLQIGPMDILLSEARITGVALSCNAFPSVIEEMAAGVYPAQGWVETIAFDALISEGFERLHRQEGTKILVDVGIMKP